MKVAVPISRFLVTVLSLVLFGGVRVRAQDVDVMYAVMGETTVKEDASAKNQPPAHAKLSPDLEKKVQEVIEQLKKQRTGVWTSQMTTRIGEIASATGLSDAGRQALGTAATQAVSASVEACGSQMLQLAQQSLAQNPGLPQEQVLRMVINLNNRNGDREGNDNPSGSHFATPEQQTVWTKALHQALTPAQLDTWTQAQTQHQAEIDKLVSTIVKTGVERTRDQESSAINIACKDMENTLKLPADRSAQLEAAGKAAVDQTVAIYGKRVRDWLLARDPAQLKPLTNNGWSMGIDEDESPTKQSAWTDGLAHILTASEQAQLQTITDARRAKRQHVMGQIMVMLLDDKLALTQEQRQKLEPIADRLVKDIPALYPAAAANNYYYMSPEVFYSATTKVDDAELKPILDAVQLKRWHTLNQPGDSQSDASSSDDASAPQDNEPEDVERIISSYFFDKTEGERKRELEENTLKAEDVARVAGLNAETAERLQTAARGATEQSLAAWKWFTEQQIRSQLQDLTPQNVRQRLDSLQDYFFQRRFGIPNQDAIWNQTVATELTDHQQDAWHKETDARAGYHSDAVAALSLSEFDRQTHLTDEQWNKLLPIVDGIIADNSASIDQVFSNMNGMSWYMGGPYALIPLAGVQDQDLKSILTKDQLDAWTSSPDFSNANSLWQVVSQMHPQRVHRIQRTVIED